MYVLAGMNAGFEDCVLLNDLLDQTDDNITETVQLFTEQRQKDAYAICDLALYNYMEMRDLVTKPSFKIRKVIDNYLTIMWPDLWMPLYNSVSFSHIRYSQCVENRKWQNKVSFVVNLSSNSVNCCVSGSFIRLSSFVRFSLPGFSFSVHLTDI